MGQRDMYICDMCLEDIKGALEVEQKSKYCDAMCEWCGKRKQVKWSRVHYGKKRERQLSDY